MTAFLSLDDNDPIVETINCLGEGHISMSTDDVSETTPAMSANSRGLGQDKDYHGDDQDKVMEEDEQDLD